MKRAVIYTIIFLNALISYGQKEHLEPTTFDVGGGLEIYYKNLNTLLYDGMADKPYARFIAIPSFSKEYAFSVEKENGEYFIISISLSESYWYAKKKRNVKFETKKNKINQKTYDQICYLFQLLANQTKSYEEKNFGLDGETYYFITTDNKGEIKIGEIWSPDDNSLMGRLVKISNNLYSIGNGNHISITEINDEIAKLINEFEK